MIAATADTEQPSVEGCEDRLRLYRLLAEALGEIPTERLVRAFSVPEVAAAFTESGYSFGLDSLPAGAGPAADALQIEYGRLFVGPDDHIPPYESLYRADEKGELWGKCTQKVNRRMKAWGLEPKLKGKVPDHIGLEFDFMAHLAAAEAEAIRGGDTERASTCHQAQRVFSDEHLLVWLPLFAKKVGKRARLPFYAELTRFAVELLENDRPQLADTE